MTPYKFFRLVFELDLFGIRGFEVFNIPVFHVGFGEGFDFMARGYGLLLVLIEYILCNRTFQRVILLFANIIQPKRLWQTIDMGSLKGQVAVLNKKADLHIFIGAFVF